MMASINFKKASLEIRELFAFTSEQKRMFCEHLKSNPNILGSVLLNTCNRTELYLCVKDEYISPAKLICDFKKLNEKFYNVYFDTIKDEYVLKYLCQLSCGAKSQLWGEDQILTQLKDSQLSARKLGTLNNVLEVMFRTAITCGKKSKNQLFFKNFNDSSNNIAIKTLEKIKEVGNVKTVMVIGNGVIGNLVAEQLIKENITTYMTLRTYKHGGCNIQKQAIPIDYEKRYEKICICDAIVSATSSQHLTITKNLLINNIPKLFIDLALPRDIDYEINTISDLYNIDELCKDEIQNSREIHMAMLNDWIQKFEQDFDKWYKYYSKIKTGVAN